MYRLSAHNVYCMGSHSVYNRDVCEVETTVKNRILEGKICYNLVSDRA